MISYNDYNLIKNSKDDKELSQRLKKFKLSKNDIENYEKYSIDVTKINTMIQSLGGKIINHFNISSTKYVSKYNFELEEVFFNNENNESFYIKIYDSFDSRDYFCDYNEVNKFKRIADKNNKKIYFLFYLNSLIFLFDYNQIKEFNYLINEKCFAYNKIDDIFRDKYFITSTDIKIVSYYSDVCKGNRIKDLYHGFLCKEEYYVGDELVHSCDLDSNEISPFLFFTGALRVKGAETQVQINNSNYSKIIQTYIPKNTILSYHEIFIDGVSHIEHSDIEELNFWDNFYKNNSKDDINEKYELSIKVIYIKLKAKIFKFDGPTMNEIFDSKISPLIIDFLKIPQSIQTSIDFKKNKIIGIVRILCCILALMSFLVISAYYLMRINEDQLFPIFFKTEIFASVFIITACVLLIIFVIWRIIISLKLNKMIKVNSKDTKYGSCLFDTIVNRFLISYRNFLIYRNVAFCLISISLGMTIVSTQCNKILLFWAVFMTLLLFWITIISTVFQVIRQTIDYNTRVSIIVNRKKSENSDELYKKIDNYAKQYFYDHPILKILSLTYRETTDKKQFKMFKKQIKQYISSNCLIDIVE